MIRRMTLSNTISESNDPAILDKTKFHFDLYFHISNSFSTQETAPEQHQKKVMRKRKWRRTKKI